MQETLKAPGLEETRLAKLMFTLAVVYLLILAGMLHRHQIRHSDETDQVEVYVVHAEEELRIQSIGLGILWPAFVVESWVRYFRRDKSVHRRSALVQALLVSLVPPLRLSARSLDGTGGVWLPYLGWQLPGRAAEKRLQRFFGLPMIIIALLVLPLLAIQYGWEKQVEESEALAFFLAAGNALVWFAFAFEFLIMIGVTDKKLHYCLTHWVDLAIVLLPVIHFLPVVRAVRAFQIFRILRLEQLTRLGRLYRLRGLSLKAFRALLVLELVRRLIGQSLEAQLRQLEEMLQAKELEVEELRKEIQDIKERIAQKKEQAIEPFEKVATTGGASQMPVPEEVRKSP